MMALPCIYGVECTGCVSCEDCVRYAESQNDYDRRIDTEYDKTR